MTETSNPQVYIAFHDAPNDGGFANRLARDFTAAGAAVYALEDSAHAPADARELLVGASASRTLLILISPDSVAAQWVRSAVDLQLAGAIEPTISRIIAVIIAPTPEDDIPQAWRALPRLDANAGYEAARDTLISALGLPAFALDALQEEASPDAQEREAERKRSEAPVGSAVADAYDDDDDYDDEDDDERDTLTRHSPEAEEAEGAESPQQERDALPEPIPLPATQPALRGLPPELAPYVAPPNFAPPTTGAPVASPIPKPLAPSTPGAPPPPPINAPWPSAPYGAAAPPVGEYDAMPATQPGGRSGPSQPIAALERVAFTSYYQKELAPNTPTPLLVYLALDEAAAQAKVAAQAAERLAGRLDRFRAGTADERLAMVRGAKLRIIPTIPGFRINPQWMDVTWDDDAQQHEFTIRADTAPEDRATSGYVRIYQGLTIRAEIPLSIYVTRGVGGARTPTDFASAIARAYRKVFASYSHHDTPVVTSCEAAAQALGDRYLRDVITLQSGQQWNQRLMQMIVEADVFQLFWSRNAAASPAVREEWQYALTLNNIRPGFVRPVYWTPTPYSIPRELEPFHFEPLDLSAIGWGPMRRFFYNMQVG